MNVFILHEEKWSNHQLTVKTLNTTSITYHHLLLRNLFSHLLLQQAFCTLSKPSSSTVPGIPTPPRCSRTSLRHVSPCFPARLPYSSKDTHAQLFLPSRKDISPSTAPAEEPGNGCPSGEVGGRRRACGCCNPRDKVGNRGTEEEPLCPC